MPIICVKSYKIAKLKDYYMQITENVLYKLYKFACYLNKINKRPIRKIIFNVFYTSYFLFPIPIFTSYFHLLFTRHPMYTIITNLLK